jgi:hypothetical protein
MDITVTGGELDGCLIMEMGDISSTRDVLLATPKKGTLSAEEVSAGPGTPLSVMRAPSVDSETLQLLLALAASPGVKEDVETWNKSGAATPPSTMKESLHKSLHVARDSLGEIDLDVRARQSTARPPARLWLAFVDAELPSFPCFACRWAALFGGGCLIPRSCVLGTAR